MSSLETAQQDLASFETKGPLPSSVRDILVSPEDSIDDNSGRVSRLSSQTGRSAILSITEGGQVGRILVQDTQGGAWWFDSITGNKL